MTLRRGKAPRRTEADISAALTELAQRAPSAEAVLTAVRDAGAHRQQGSPRTPGARGLRGTWRLAVPAPRPRWWPQLAVAAAAAGTAIALAVALTPGSAPVRARLPDLAAPPSPLGGVPTGSAPPVVSPGRHPSAASVAKTMLAALDATASYLVVWTSVGYTKGHPSGTSMFWNWPAVPVPGQLEYTRTSYGLPAAGRSEGTGAGLTEDIGYTTVVPPPSRYGQNAYARLIVVCYAGSGQTACGYGRHNVAPGTWWTRTGMLGYVDFTPDPSGAALVQQIAHGDWRILGHTRLHGQKVIKLAETPAGHFMPLPVVLWVSTATYLPLRMAWLSGGSGEFDTWHYLPPTKANLALLRVPIPPGYPRSG